jgi:hypothetical protein
MLRPAAALALALLVESMNVLSAQSTSASLKGRVTDPSKAVIAGAKIAGIKTSTDVEYDTTSNASGDYDLPDLSPGTYRLEIEKTGFKKLIKPDVILHVQDAAEIDFEMTVGSVTESITVEGGAPLVDTESATVSTVIDRDVVDNLHAHLRRQKSHSQSRVRPRSLPARQGRPVSPCLAETRSRLRVRRPCGATYRYRDSCPSAGHRNSHIEGPATRATRSL